MPSFLAYQSGQYKPLEEVSIALNDAGFVYGATVTDQCRTYRQKPFRLEEHLQRFRRSCELCRISHPWSNDKLNKIIERLINNNSPHVRPETEWSIVWLTTPGRVGSFLGETGTLLDAIPELIVYCFPLPFQRFRSYYDSGAEIRTVENENRVYGGLRQAKHRCRLNWWMTEERIRSQLSQAQILFVEQDTVTETSSANLVIIRNGQVFSPPRERILNGVSLKVVEELCRQLSIPFWETRVTADNLTTADEALLCSTPYGIAPIGNLNGRQMPVNGPVFERLLAAWNDLVGLDIRQQFLSANS